MRRVVVTGLGGVTAFGNDWNSISSRLKNLENAVVKVDEWSVYDGLNSLLGAPIPDFKVPSHYTRRQTRSMGRVAQMATVATEDALKDSGLLNDEVLTSGQAGVAYGSSTGSTDTLSGFGLMFNDKTTRHIHANTYMQMMSHTAAVNVALFFGLRGRLIPTSSACTSGSQAIGYAFEAIRNGYQTIMVAGGGEELCPSEVAVFDTLFATSLKNDSPKTTPSPFDVNRDGLVIGEGAATLVLEELEHAKSRGARIYAEIVGFATNCDASHITQPKLETIQSCMEMALACDDVSPEAVGYVSAHGTATEYGDITESKATKDVFGSKIPISSLKSYFGHTLGACGAIEAWLCIKMMHDGWFSPTLNLENLDPACSELDYLTGEGRNLDIECLMSNNFAFGGINTSLIFRREA
ncbi:MAG: beta-ketoacyl-ACP synthase [Desulfuromonadales bacterium]|nr:beta-ketoacyl-ACP synthase [Desulfuromonadales bacterium]